MQTNSVVTLMFTSVLGLCYPVANAAQTDSPGKSSNLLVNTLFSGSTVEHIIEDQDGIAEFWLYQSHNSTTGRPRLLKHKTFDCDTTKKWKISMGAVKSMANSTYQIQFVDCSDDDNEYHWQTTPQTATAPGINRGGWIVPDPDESPMFDNEGDGDGSSWWDWLLTDTNGDLIDDVVIVVNDDQGMTLTVMSGFGDGTFSQPSAEDGSIVRVPHSALSGTDSPIVGAAPYDVLQSDIQFAPGTRMNDTQKQSPGMIEVQRLNEILTLTQ